MMEESWIEKRMRETAHPAGGHFVMENGIIWYRSKRISALQESVIALSEAPSLLQKVSSILREFDIGLGKEVLRKKRKKIL